MTQVLIPDLRSPFALPFLSVLSIYLITFAFSYFLLSPAGDAVYYFFIFIFIYLHQIYIRLYIKHYRILSSKMKYVSHI